MHAIYNKPDLSSPSRMQLWCNSWRVLMSQQVNAASSRPSLQTVLLSALQRRLNLLCACVTEGGLRETGTVDEMQMSGGGGDKPNGTSSGGTPLAGLWQCPWPAQCLSHPGPQSIFRWRSHWRSLQVVTNLQVISSNIKHQGRDPGFGCHGLEHARLLGEYIEETTELNFSQVISPLHRAFQVELTK